MSVLVVLAVLGLLTVVVTAALTFTVRRAQRGGVVVDRIGFPTMPAPRGPQ